MENGIPPPDNHLKFISFYDDCKNSLLTYLMYRLNFNRQLAEDLFMDIVLKAYEKFNQFDPQKGSFKNWIFTIAHNHLVNYWRDRKEACSLEALEEFGLVAAITEPNEAIIQHSIDHHQIQNILSKLSCEERSIITLRFLEERDINQIAKILNKKKGAVRTQLSRALKHFGRYYNKIYPKFV